MQCKQSKKVSKRYTFLKRRQDFAPLEDITLCPALTQSRKGHGENFSILMPFLVTCATGVYCVLCSWCLSFPPSPPIFFDGEGTHMWHMKYAFFLTPMIYFWTKTFWSSGFRQFYLYKSTIIDQDPSKQSGSRTQWYRSGERVRACTVHCAIACVSLSLSLLPDPALLTIFSRSVTVEVSL